jgi:general secretion pathway protein A
MAVPKPVPAPASAAASLAWPADLPREQSLDLAFASLYAIWGAPAPTEHCPAGEPLRCRTARGGLDELRQLDRPALLYLSDAQGNLFHAVLVNLTRQHATLQMGADRQIIDLPTLAAHWAGRYTVLWQVPVAVPDQIRPKETGPAIAWLAQQLALALHEPAPEPLPDKWHAALRDRLKRFQLAQGLAPDGQAGAHTLVRLSSVNDTHAPRLITEGQ